MTFKKDMLLLYAITDRKWVGNQTLYEQIEDALKGGITILQLREKNLPENEFLEEANNVLTLCHKYNVPLIINDNVDIALKIGADGVHVGIEDTLVSEIRKNAPKDFIIGATAKTVEQAKNAEADGADYLGVGAIFPSSTKKNAICITGKKLREICSSVSIPSVVIGGITYENMLSIEPQVANGVAVVSAVFGAENIENSCIKLKERAKTIAKMF